MLKHRFNYKHQKGFTITGWIVVAFIGGYFAYLAMILTPVLIDNNTVDTILESLQDEPGITQKTRHKIWRLIENRLTVNQIKNLKQEDFDIVKGQNTVEVFMEYEDRVQFAGNIFIVFERNKSVELIRH